MRPKLKEDAKEWWKFALTGAVVGSAICIGLWRRGTIGDGRFRMVIGLIALMLLAGLVWPRAIRPVYRVIMTGSFYIGQVMGRVMLGLFFLFALTPIGLVLRFFGKDLLRIKRNPQAQTYWRPARPNEDFNRQF